MLFLKVMYVDQRTPDIRILKYSKGLTNFRSENFAIGNNKNFSNSILVLPYIYYLQYF